MTGKSFANALPDHADLDAEYEQHLGAKLAVIEELRVELGKEGIQCPGVIAIGAQSAGKSSVLERLTGISFPRGENTCTRVPTIVQLQTDPTIEQSFALVSTDAGFQEATLCHTSNEIQESILKNTAQITGSTKRPISNTPIQIRYKRKRGPVMTLIDLPGITHVDAEHESFDIHAETSNMVKEYVSNENMVVLVVIPANDDFGNSEALQIARQFDKEGKRTIGVISKCDLVPENSSDIVKKIRMMRESDVKLALGFIAVRNKGPDEADIDLEAAEENLFSNHSVLKTLLFHEKGYQTLSKKIVELQSSRVNHFIPEVRSLVRKKIFEAEEELMIMGGSPSTPGERRTYLTKELCELSHTIEKLIRAEGTNDEINIAAITFDLAQNFASSIRASVPKFCSHEYFLKLMKRIRKSMGYCLPNFISDTIFREQIIEVFFEGRLKTHSNILIEDTRLLMEKVFEDRIRSRNELAAFPRLPNALLDQIGRCLQKSKSRAIDVVNCILQAEKHQVFTQNDRYMSTINETRGSIDNERKILSTENEMKEIAGDMISAWNKRKAHLMKQNKRGEIASKLLTDEFISSCANNESEDPAEESSFELQIALSAYSEILMNRLFDVIPVVVRSLLVNELHQLFHVSIQKAFGDDQLEYLFSEEDSVQRKRISLEACLSRMRMAERKLRQLI